MLGGFCCHRKSELIKVFIYLKPLLLKNNYFEFEIEPKQLQKYSCAI